MPQWRAKSFYNNIYECAKCSRVVVIHFANERMKIVESEKAFFTAH